MTRFSRRAIALTALALALAAFLYAQVSWGNRTFSYSEAAVLNYHPAFADTLLGLRLFQLDVLVGEEASGDLPKVSGAHLLGAGEAAPDVRANEEGAVQFSQHIASVEAATRAEFRSYLICDYGRKISFRLQEDAIVLTGDPYFYCWRSASDEPGFNEERVRNEAATGLAKNCHRPALRAGVDLTSGHGTSRN